MENREQTFGEKAVGFTFNPSQSGEVDEIKRTCAAAIDEINHLRDFEDCEEAEDGENGERKAMYTLAIRRIQEGQMWAVKAATWRKSFIKKEA